jgi:hypothetical protein
LVQLAEKALNYLPSKINNLRDPNKLYEPSEAKSILEANALLAANYDLTEECVSANGVFSAAGRKELFAALTKQQTRCEMLSCPLHLYPLHVFAGCTQQFIICSRYTSH